MDNATGLLPGIDYPRTFQEVDEWFRTDSACRDYIRRLRWPSGFVCPFCGWTGEPWVTSRGLLHCRGCQGQTSLTAGTIFQNTRKPLRQWFIAMWYVTNQKGGVSALGLQKLPRAMVRPGRDALSGTVEVDETYVGGIEKGRHGRETETKAIIAVAAEENGEGIGRIRIRRVKDVSGASLLPFVQSAVVPGAVVHTDGWSGYAGLTAAGYKHEVTVVSASPDPAHVVMPRVHNIAALLKRWMLGTHQGGIQHVHLDYYLAASASGFNRRRSKARGLLFHRLAQQAVAIGPASYNTIVNPNKSVQLPNALE